MRKLLFATAGVLSLSACKYQYQIVTTNTSPEEAHYVILRSRVNGESQQFFDCMSMPDGRTWNPTCVPVEIVKRNADKTVAAIGTRTPAPKVVMLITEDEAAQAALDLASRGVASQQTDGPAIRVGAPTSGSTFAGPVDIDIAIEPGANGLPPNFETLKVTYLRAWGIDITSRILPYFDNGRIAYAGAPFPAGQHAVEFYIEDIEQNVSRTVVDIVVK